MPSIIWFRSVVSSFLCPLLLALVVASMFGSAGGGGGGYPDNTPPKFAGLESATTCIPGPVGGGRTTSYNLSWKAATDNVSPSSAIIYDVYQADTSGAEDYSTPTYVTPAGATSFATPQLPTEKHFYFVVRARDQSGNSDFNTIEREGQNLCD